MKEYVRKSLFDNLWKGIKGEPRLIQVIIGPRQIGKTTLALQVYNKWNGPKLYESADLPNIPTTDWIMKQWEEARARCKMKGQETLLILDEIQKIPRWSEVAKKMFDEDKRLKIKMRVILLGSSSLLIQKGLTETLAGRFEIHRHNHWSFNECKEYFNLPIDEYIYFGGYPGAIPLRKDEQRWAKYVRDSLIETVLSKDVLLMSPITKPALLRQVFGLCISYPAQIISYQKMIGQLQNAGNTTTIAHYIKLLNNAFLIAPLEKYSGSVIRQRGSIPKILILDNALISAIIGRGFKTTLNDKIFWGRMIENAIGAKLYSAMQEVGGNLFYWRDRNNEVDYIVKLGHMLIAIEVKSGVPGEAKASLDLFARKYKNTKKVILFASDKEFRQAKKCKNENGSVFLNLKDFFLNPYLTFKI